MKLAGADMRFYGSVSKVEDLDDGTIIVEGIASSEAVDCDGEVIKASAMQSAIEEYMEFGNIREMHQAKAAGTALDIFVDANGDTRLKAHIVDGEAVKKVKTKVYKGFSIGGRATSRDKTDKTIITGIRLYEISLVDRPANPKAKLEMWKADNIEGVQDMKIETAEQLAEAIKAYKPEDDKDTVVKTSIIDAANLLKAVDTLPEDWRADAVAKSATDDEIEKAKAKKKNTKASKTADDKEMTAEQKAAADKKKAEDDEAAAKAANPAGDSSVGEVIQKGLYEVSQFASLLQSLFWLQQCCDMEREREKDDSKVPDQLQAAITTLGEILVSMTNEEVKELFGVEADNDDNDVELAALNISLKKVADVTTRDALVKYLDNVKKKGARHSAADQARINAIHKTATELGSTYAPETSDDDKDKANLTGDVKKLFDGMTEELKKFVETNDKLEKRVKELEAMPQPAKGATVVVSKGADTLTSQESEEVNKAAEQFAAIKDPVEKGKFLLKQIHAHGGKPVA